jgi:hypothetical protein
VNLPGEPAGGAYVSEGIQRTARKRKNTYSLSLEL